MNPRAWFRPRGARPAPPAEVSRRIAAWLASHTYHHEQFTDVRALVERKRQLGVRISLCLPSLNEGRTIGKEVVLFRSELMIRQPLLDEIVVIDSGSTDSTREIAASFGAQVHLADAILPEQGVWRGKGENLWKAVYQLEGDIIVFIDADIANIRPHFAVGLIGPLLLRPEVRYVKAFYERPLATGRGTTVPGGGRVTEILVRPLFSMYFPELTAFVQPLSGEYAARREALEQIPFPVGYGVETSHLIDVHHRWGLDAMAQTDLGRRVHRNQDTQALGRMAFGILHTFERKLEAYGMMRSKRERSTLLRQFQGAERNYAQAEIEIAEPERPPMIGIPDYQRKFGRAP